MFKLLIVLLFILKIKTENENNFKMSLTSKGILFDLPHTEKARSSISNKERLYLANPVTQSALRDDIGQRIEYKPEGVLENDKNEEFSLFKRNSEELADSFTRSRTGQQNREKILQVNGLNSQNLQNQKVIPILPYKSKLLHLISTTKPLKNSNRNNVYTGSPIKNNVGNLKSNKENILSTAKGVTEVPYNFLENVVNEGNDEEHIKNNHDNLGISNYKPDTRLDPVNDCLPNVNMVTKKYGTPMILFDSEQSDEGVSLILSLINLNTLKPKTRYYFTENKFVKKVMTQDRCKFLTKASTKKSTTNSCTEKKSTTITCQTKKRKKAACSTENTTCKRPGCKNITPLFTVEPWPDLTITRNICNSSKSKPNSKLKMAHAAFSSVSSRTQSAPTLPTSNGKSTKKDARVEITLLSLPLPNSSTTFNNTGQKVHSSPGVQTEFTSSSHVVLGTDITSTTSNSQGDLKLSSSNWTQLAPAASGPGDGVKTSSTAEPEVSRPGASSNQIQISVPSSSLLTTLVSLSRGSTLTPTTYSTQEYNVFSFIMSLNKTEFNTTSNTQPTGSSQAIPIFNETNVNSSTKTTQKSTLFSPSSNLSQTKPTITPLIAEVNQVVPTNTKPSLDTTLTETLSQQTKLVTIPQENARNTEIKEPLTVTNTFLEISIANNDYSNRALTNSPLQETINSNQPAGENTICVNLSLPSESSGSPGLYSIITNGSSDLNKKIQQGVGRAGTVEYQVAETTSSLFPLCPRENNYSSPVESVGILKETESLNEPQIMSFSPPPPAVFSHEPEFIETLFNDAKNGASIGLCHDLLGIPLSTTDMTGLLEQQSSHLEDQLVSPQATSTALAKEPVKGNIQLDGLNSESTLGTLSPTKPFQSILLGYLKSVSMCNTEGTFSKGPFNAYFSESVQNVSKCLEDYSRLFSKLATSKCE